MSAETITAIGAVIVGIAALFNAFFANRKRDTDLNNRLDSVDNRLDGVERRLDNHNHYAELFAESSARSAQIETDIKWICKYLGKEGDGNK